MNSCLPPERMRPDARTRTLEISPMKELQMWN